MTSSCPAGRTQRRSRFGCRNCKLRKLKCDENRPQCKRCRSFGVLCNFMSNVPDLQPVTRESDRGWPLSVQPRTKAAGKLQFQRPLTASVWTSDASYHYQLNSRCQDFITRYLGRSLITPDDANMAHVNRKLLELAFTHPYLMHASLAVAFTYDRHLNIPGTLGNRRTVEECFHWSQATALLNRRLKQSIAADPEDKDAIWGTAAALVILTFSSPNARSPEEAWPLKAKSNSSHFISSSEPASSSSLSSEPDLDPNLDSELNWLRMSTGKMSLWTLVNPLRPESLFSIMAHTFNTMLSPFPSPQSGIDGIPQPLAQLCTLGYSSTPSDNPYFLAAHAVSTLLDLPDCAVGMGEVYLFMRILQFQDPNSDSGHCGRGIRELLRMRDPVALLLLYLWYQKAGRAVWWIQLRARVEGPAIEMFLRRDYGRNRALIDILDSGTEPLQIQRKW
ncbi:hypothetical protein BDW69DRAFT_200135 [Aspergillus filifer]